MAKRKGGSSKQKAKFKASAKACKGQKLSKFRACMKRKLKK